MTASQASVRLAPFPVGIPLIERAASHADRIAIVDDEVGYTYADLGTIASRVAGVLRGESAHLEESRVAFLVAPGFAYAVVQWGIWLAGGIAVPLCTTHPLPELTHAIEDADANTVIVDPGFRDRIGPALGRGRRVLLTPEVLDGQERPLPAIATDQRAMLLYTSGTTGRPRGVVTTHRNIAAQVRTLVQAWEWQPEDRILNVLPLHHVHGIINILSCALWSGATCDFLPRFDAERVWERFLSHPYTLFMAVPTIYVKLIAAWDAAPTHRQRLLGRACRKFRLMVSGSAALPLSVFDRWQAISGQALLERYGMTEIGMALSNPLHGERRPGTVGMPLPGVRVRLVDDGGAVVRAEGTPGQIQIRGDSVFLEYWRHPGATRAAFRQGWFLTGDTAVVERGYYRLLGRNSVDMIKTGGFKVSALEIEEVLRAHPAIAECAVVGLDDPEWGQRVAAAVVPRHGAALGLAELRRWARELLAIYKVPSRLLVLDQLPRNAMGKTTKPEIRRLFAASE
jgi:malonyl-CoA/methylmalonyl-CoA synthetase